MQMQIKMKKPILIITAIALSLCARAQSIDEGILVGIFADDGRKFKSLYSQQNLLSENEYKEAETRLPPITYFQDS